MKIVALVVVKKLIKWRVGLDAQSVRGIYHGQTRGNVVEVSLM